MRVVLDSNVVVAAFAAHGLCHLVFENVLAEHALVLSPGLLEEIERALMKKLKLPPAKIKEAILFLKNEAELLKDQDVDRIECRDLDDIKVLSLAINGKVDSIVTGDQDLLVLKQIQGISILTPREFWERLRSHAK